MLLRRWLTWRLQDLLAATHSVKISSSHATGKDVLAWVHSVEGFARLTQSFKISSPRQLEQELLASTHCQDLLASRSRDRFALVTPSFKICSRRRTRSRFVQLTQVVLKSRASASPRPVTCQVTAILVTWRRRPYFSMATKPVTMATGTVTWLARPEW